MLSLSKKTEMFADTIPKSIGVMIATYHRPFELHRCLVALHNQLLPPNDVIVVVRQDDWETQQILKMPQPTFPTFRVVVVDIPGVVAARNAGLKHCSTDILAIIDDDTSPHPDWLQKILDAFSADPTLGGLGGRDRCFDGSTFDDRRQAPVGRIQWFGRVIGNHHLGFGPIREVDVLKGANMSFRALAVVDVSFDARLEGIGTQPNEDKAFSVAVKAKGWKLMYDPTVLVDHYPGFRPDERQYVGVNRVLNIAHYKSFSYNEVLSIWAALTPVRRCVFLLWSYFIGTATCPGLLQAIRFSPSLGIYSWQRFWIAQTAKIKAYRDLLFPQSLRPLRRIKIR